VGAVMLSCLVTRSRSASTSRRQRPACIPEPAIGAGLAGIQPWRCRIRHRSDGAVV
jgi:hypothetical protein